MFEKMLEMAKEAQDNSYAPYSNFNVGACIRSGDKFFTGTNIENVSYSLTQCAESSALGAMITAGCKVIDEILIIGSGTNFCSPCGACRQRLLEFAATPNIPVHFCNATGEFKTAELNKLLPESFCYLNNEEK